MLDINKPFSLHLNPDLFKPATDEEKAYISQMRPSSTFFKDGVKRLVRNRVALVSLIVIVLVTLASIIIPMCGPIPTTPCWACVRASRSTAPTITSRPSPTARLN